mmetsp:Transcript_20499/g.59436  ORF Transcript_20499/g.59436 Transcript_20499/m.59436 type:complete len:225 (+) Transcript_20499:985-1659(+)
MVLWCTAHLQHVASDRGNGRRPAVRLGPGTGHAHPVQRLLHTDVGVGISGRRGRHCRVSNAPAGVDMPLFVRDSARTGAGAEMHGSLGGGLQTPDVPEGGTLRCVLPPRDTAVPLAGTSRNRCHLGVVGFRDIDIPRRTAPAVPVLRPGRDDHLPVAQLLLLHAPCGHGRGWRGEGWAVSGRRRRRRSPNRLPSEYGGRRPSEHHYGVYLVFHAAHGLPVNFHL